MVLSRIAKSAFTKFPCRLLSSPHGCLFSTLPSKTTKRKATPKIDQPKPKTYVIHDFREIEDDNITPFDPILASPLVQIFSVSINTNFDDERPCNVYGSIRATEGEGGDNFSLYDRDHDNPETILKHGNLSLNGPQCNDFSCSLGTTRTKLELSLKDKARNNMEFIKAQLILDSNTEEIENSYDKLKTAIVGDEHGYGFASVNYATFRFAVFAFVEVAIFAKYDVSRPYSEIYGSIVAGYGNSKSYSCRKDDEINSMKKCTTLFNKSSPDQSVRAIVGVPLSLSRYVVAVPVHSSLKIEAHLWDSQDLDGPFASGSVEFLGPCSASNKLIRGEGGSVVVAVTWDNAFRRPYDADAEAEAEEQLRDAQEKALMLQHEDLPLRRSTYWFTDELVEVFSIYVDSKANEVPAVCGLVEINQNGEHIFERDISDPEFCSEDKRMISFQGHWSTSFTPILGIMLHLKDPVLGHVISQGELGWWRTFSWYDKRLCSVIEGPDGFAAIHYIILCNACTAFIQMTLFSDDSTLPSVNIYGCVFARYKSYDYSSVYEKRYYQSRLFDKPESEAVQLTTTQQSKLPMLKSAVSMPIDDSLIVEANLWATSNGNPTEQIVFGTVEFEVDLDDSSRTIHKKIQGQRYCIQISVQQTPHLI